MKGAVWTVDEVEFYKRRPQKLTGYVYVLEAVSDYVSSIFDQLWTENVLKKACTVSRK